MTKAARVLNSVRQTDQGKEKRVLTEKEEGERERERERGGGGILCLCQRKKGLRWDSICDKVPKNIKHSPSLKRAKHIHARAHSRKESVHNSN